MEIQFHRMCGKEELPYMLDLATDMRPGPWGHGPVKCCVCHQIGKMEFPLGKCVACPHWAYLEHLRAPNCLVGVYPACPCHSEISYIGPTSLELISLWACRLLGVAPTGGCQWSA
eukprot:305339-Amphidinium_carterae.1